MHSSFAMQTLYCKLWSLCEHVKMKLAKYASKILRSAFIAMLIRGFRHFILRFLVDYLCYITCVLPSLLCLNEQQKLFPLACLLQLAAFMINHMTWNTNDSESFLEVEVKLKLCLEVINLPTIDHDS